MKTTKELMEKAKAAQTVEELEALAKAENIELAPGEAEAIFAQLHQTGELSDEELENVSGGGCAKGTESPFKVGEEVLAYYWGNWVDATVVNIQERGFASWHVIILKETKERFPWIPTCKLRKKK